MPSSQARNGSWQVISLLSRTEVGSRSATACFKSEGRGGCHCTAKVLNAHVHPTLLQAGLMRKGATHEKGISSQA